MADWTTVAILTLGCVGALYTGKRALAKRTSHPLPPGPPGLPWVGSVIGVDAATPWKTYAKWAETYGDIIYVKQFGKDVIIINSDKVAKDLLENRSRIYSDHPYLITVELCGMDFHSALMPYGDTWRLHRRFFHQTFRHEAVSRFLPMQHEKSCVLLRRLLDSPEHLEEHLFEFTSSVILRGTYDYDSTSRKDELIELIEYVLKTIVPALRPDVTIMLEAIPLLRHLPSWFPGMSFKKQMETSREFSKHYLERPFQYSLQKVASDSTEPSMVRDALGDLKEKGISPEKSWMEELKKVSGSALVAASETSHSFLMTFFLWMVLNPTVQEKAQAQIDAVVGKDRLPTINDRPLLPYVDAILWEVLRTPICPIPVPRTTMEDDVYNGYHIPKGALVFTNLWSMAHDESRYPNSDSFLPERFLNDDGSLKPNEVENLAFGFGRRICVGRHFADTSVWSVISKVLAMFQVLKAVDENGVEVPVEPNFSSGLVISPLPFKCRIVPRIPGMDAEKLEGLIAASTV